MADIYEICRQDFTAARLAFEERDFRLLNILGNRSMSNVLFGNGKDDNILALPGFFLKDVALDFLTLKDETRIADLYRTARDSIERIDEAFKRELDLAEFWSTFSKYSNDARGAGRTVAEGKAYKDNLAFTSQAFSILMSTVVDKDLVFQQHSMVIKGFLYEADRIIRCHGADDTDFLTTLLMRCADWLNDYYRQAFSSGQGVIDLERVKGKLLPLLESIKQWRDEKEKSPFKNASTILCNAIVEWRRCFVLYLERSRVSAEAERRIELPVEAKKRIGETIADALQKDLGKRGKK